MKELFLGNFYNIENYITEPFKFEIILGHLLGVKIIFYNFLKFEVWHTNFANVNEPL